MSTNNNPNAGMGWLRQRAKDLNLFPGESPDDGRRLQAASRDELIQALQGAGVTIPSNLLNTTETRVPGPNDPYPRIPVTNYDPNYRLPGLSDPIGVLPQASYLYQHGGPPVYPYPTQAWFNPLQEQGYLTTLQGLQHGVGQGLQNQAMAHGALQGFGNYLGQQGMQTSPEFINQIPGSFNPWNNPALDDAVMRANQATTRDFMQGVMPQIRARAMGMGQSGSSRHGIQEGLAQQALIDQLGQQTANMYTQGFDTGMNRFVADRSNTLNSWLGANRNALQGWGLMPGYVGMTGGANTAAAAALASLGAGQSQIGQYYQGMSNQMLGEQKRLWDEYAARPYDNLDWYARLVYGNPGNDYGERTTNAPNPTLAQGLGAGALFYGIGQNQGWWGGGSGGGVGSGDPFGGIWSGYVGQ